MSVDDISAVEIVLVLTLILFVWFLVVPFALELTTTHTETVTVRGTVGNIVEDLQGNLWELQGLDRYTLAEIRPGTSLEITWIGPRAGQGTTCVSVTNITWAEEDVPG